VDIPEGIQKNSYNIIIEEKGENFNP